MNLRTLVKKRSEPRVHTRTEGWGDAGDAPFFTIAAIDRTLAERIEEESVNPEKPFRTEKTDGFRPRQVPNIDPELRTENLVYHAIRGWEEFTVGHLPSVISLDYDLHEVAALDKSTPMDWSDDNRRVIAQASSPQFRAWVLSVSSDVAAYHAEAERVQTGNSLSTSAGV